MEIVKLEKKKNTNIQSHTSPDTYNHHHHTIIMHVVEEYIYRSVIDLIDLKYALK